MSVKTELNTLTVEDYLTGEQHSEVRHELVQGQPCAMVGTSNINNLITIALVSALRSHLRGGPCRAYMADMKVRVSDDFYYPDVTVSCTPAPGPFYFIADPVLIAEVLSESTERIDRHEKRLAYQRLTSLKEYVLVTQDKVSIEVYRRLERGWELERFSENDTLRLEAVGFTIPVTDLYQDVMNVP